MATTTAAFDRDEPPPFADDRTGNRPAGHSSSDSKKRPRPAEDESETTCSVEDEDDQGCRCPNDGCPWQWDSSSTSSSSSSSTAAAATTTSSSMISGVGEPSYLHGPLLSVKEYRDRRTGEVRCVRICSARTMCETRALLLSLFRSLMSSDHRTSVFELAYILYSAALGRPPGVVHKPRSSPTHSVLNPVAGVEVMPLSASVAVVMEASHVCVHSIYRVFTSSRRR